MSRKRETPFNPAVQRLLTTMRPSKDDQTTKKTKTDNEDAKDNGKDMDGNSDGTDTAA